MLGQIVLAKDLLNSSNPEPVYGGHATGDLIGLTAMLYHQRFRDEVHMVERCDS